MATLFGSRIRNPAKVDVTDAYVLTNVPPPTTNIGAELLATLRHEPLSGTATYTYVRWRKLDGTQHPDVPLLRDTASGSLGSGNPRT